MNHYLITLDGAKGFMEITIRAIGPAQAARIAQSMYPGSRVMRILKVSGQ